MLTLPDILATYRTGTVARRTVLRAQYPRLRIEFDAIDREEDRAARRATQSAQPRTA